MKSTWVSATKKKFIKTVSVFFELSIFSKTQDCVINSLKFLKKWKFIPWVRFKDMEDIKRNVTWQPGECHSVQVIDIHTSEKSEKIEGSFDWQWGSWGHAPNYKKRDLEKWGFIGWTTICQLVDVCHVLGEKLKRQTSYFDSWLVNLHLLQRQFYVEICLQRNLGRAIWILYSEIYPPAKINYFKKIYTLWNHKKLVNRK